jgi:hypothetical protein
MLGNQSVLTWTPLLLFTLFINKIDRLIIAKDHASVQIAIADVDENGRALPTSTTFALSGPVRSQGEADDSINRLATKSGCEYFSYFDLV